MRASVSVLTCALLLAACGGETAIDTTPKPIQATAGQWSWVDFPQSACDDGTPTGIAVNPSPTGSKDVLVFLNGGGACWDALTCIVVKPYTQGPFGKAQFDAALASGLPDGTIMDRTLSGNPFKDFNLVFVPYCTGDVHAGGKVTTYSLSGFGSKTIHHVGHTNLVSYLERLTLTWPTPSRLVVTGSSAGGFGSFLNYATFKEKWPATKTYLIDDSGPPLAGNLIKDSIRTGWFGSWDLGALSDPLCGQPCRSDLSLGLTALAQNYPNDRMSLLSSEQDATITGYFQLNATTFQTGLDTLATQRIDITQNVKTFFVPGQTHTMLPYPDRFTQNGVPLLTWLTQQISDDAAWSSQRP